MASWCVCDVRGLCSLGPGSVFSRFRTHLLTERVMGSEEIPRQPLKLWILYAATEPLENARTLGRVVVSGLPYSVPLPPHSSGIRNSGDWGKVLALEAVLQVSRGGPDPTRCVGGMVKHWVIPTFCTSGKTRPRHCSKSLPLPRGGLYIMLVDVSLGFWHAVINPFLQEDCLPHMLYSGVVRRPAVFNGKQGEVTCAACKLKH